MEKLLEKTLLNDKLLSIFEEGDLGVAPTIKVQEGLLPTLKILSPNSKGTYPILLFFHGFDLQSSWYTSLLQHISSHGYIIVAPQITCFFETDEVEKAAKVAKWLISDGLKSVQLPEGVRADHLKLALSGHSRGGKTAFALALGRYERDSSNSPLNFQALLGIDPVDGISPSYWPDPKLLQHIPESFDLTAAPVAVIGTGLPNQSLAPDGFNHLEFFKECKPPCYYFVAKDYGHLDMLDDDNLLISLARFACKSGKGSKDLMRKAVGGIVVAFLKAKLEGQVEPLNNIVQTPSLAPITLDPVTFKEVSVSSSENKKILI